MCLKACQVCNGNMMQDIEDKAKFYCMTCKKSYYSSEQIEKERNEFGEELLGVSELEHEKTECEDMLEECQRYALEIQTVVTELLGKNDDQGSIELLKKIEDLASDIYRNTY